MSIKQIFHDGMQEFKGKRGDRTEKCFAHELHELTRIKAQREKKRDTRRFFLRNFCQMAERLIYFLSIFIKIDTSKLFLIKHLKKKMSIFIKVEEKAGDYAMLMLS
jgi:hypothetical protein